MKQTKAPYGWYGYVYLLKCGEMYKIGYSLKPRKRLKQFRTGSPHPIEVVHTIRTAHYKQIEKQLHWKFGSSRRMGEWFSLTDEDVTYIQSLDQNGFTPEQVLRKAEEDARYCAELAVKEQAEKDRRLAILHSGLAAGAGIIFDWLPGYAKPLTWQEKVEIANDIAWGR